MRARTHESSNKPTTTTADDAGRPTARRPFLIATPGPAQVKLNAPSHAKNSFMYHTRGRSPARAYHFHNTKTRKCDKRTSNPRYRAQNRSHPFPPTPTGERIETVCFHTRIPTEVFVRFHFGRGESRMWQRACTNPSQSRAQGRSFEPPDTTKRHNTFCHLAACFEPPAECEVK